MNEPTTTRSKRDDLIRRGDVLDKVVIYPNYSENGLSVDSYVVFDDDVMDIPAVDAVEVRHSHWEDVEVEDVGELTPLYVQSIASMRCASCNRYHNEVYNYGNPTEMACYCPYCGARMDGGEEHNAVDRL